MSILSKSNLILLKGWLITLLLIFLQLHALLIFAQSVRVISTKDGLPQSFVSGLVQDKTGFVWIGTRNGLARYDGIQFKTFQHDIHDSTTLASNIIIWLNKDEHDHIWIEYESGEIDEMNPVTEKITHFINVRSAKNLSVAFVRRGWLFDSHKIFWGIIKGGGLNSFDTTTKKIRVYKRFNKELSSDTARGLLEDKNKDLWVLTQNGLSVFNRQTCHFINILIPDKQDFNDFFDSETEVVDLHQLSNGEIMWGDRKRLFFYNPKSHFVRTLNLPDYTRFGIRWIRTGPDGNEFLETNGKVYEYSDAKGLVIFNNAALPNLGDARSFLVDQSGLIWIGTNAEGIRQIDPINPFFQSYPDKENFCADMLNQEFGLSVTKTFNWTPSDQVFTSPGYHMRSLYDHANRLWFALKNTIGCFDPAKKKWTWLPAVPSLTDSLKTDIGIKGISIMPGGMPVAIGYNGNLVKYDSSANTWRLLIPSQLLRQTFGQGLLPQDLFSDEEKIWITTANDGLLNINLKTNQVNQLKESAHTGALPTNQLLGMKPDPFRNDLLWIGSYQGLICLHKRNLNCEVFSVKDGLPDNTIYSIETDPLGNLWLGTNKGLCRFQPVTHTVRIFKSQNGLPGDEFNRFHYLKLPNGQLAFGGTEGWIKFDPLSFEDDNFKPKATLTGLKINMTDVFKDTVDGIPKPINGIDGLNLAYAQNTLTFQFAGLEFNQPQDILYRYRLAGYDKDWIIAGHSSEANYTHIPPGSYALMINASNTTGTWSPFIKKISVHIAPPWWSSTAAFFCYAIIFVGFLWGFIRYRINQAVMKREIQFRESESTQMKELNEMKTRFFSNITHEFRTPLTLIIGPAERIKKGRLQEHQQSRLADTIVKNANQLLILVNHLMDLSKLEAGALKIFEQKGNPAHIVGSVVHSFEFEATTRQIEMCFFNSLEDKSGWFYPDALERIIYNLMSNALKFTKPGGSIEINLGKENELLILTVKDTGIGISADQLSFIFERFYQGNHTSEVSKNQQAGTGIGLALVKELVDLQNGKIDVKSTAGTSTESSGTTFSVWLPFRNNESEGSSLQNPVLNLEEEGNIRHIASEKLPLVLLVEDNEELAIFIRDSLQEKYQVQHVINGALGYDAALSLMPDLIVSDVLMPVMDGFTLCSNLKNDIRTSHIPIILLTAKASRDSLMEGLSKGADDYLTKPFHPTEFLQRIHNLLERQKKLRERIKADFALPPALSAVKQPEQITDAFLNKLYKILNDHLDDTLFGVDQLVGYVDMSRTSLHRKLKSLTGMATSEFIRNYRLKCATVFLKQGLTSTETAYRSGFGSPAYFTKCFREVYGITPGEFISTEKKN